MATASAGTDTGTDVMTGATGMGGRVVVVVRGDEVVGFLVGGRVGGLI